MYLRFLFRGRYDLTNRTQVGASVPTKARSSTKHKTNNYKILISFSDMHHHFYDT